MEKGREKEREKGKEKERKQGRVYIYLRPK